MKGKMRSVQFSKPKGPLEMVEKDIPEPGPRHVRIQACSICHSDSVTKEEIPDIKYPRVPGHERLITITPLGCYVYWNSAPISTAGTYSTEEIRCVRIDSRTYKKNAGVV